MLSACTKTRVLRAFLALFALTIAGLLAGCGATSDSEQNLGEVRQNVCTGVKLSATPTGPQAAGVMVTLTASNISCGGGQSAQYLFRWFKAGSALSGTIQDWSASATASWNTTGLASGDYQVIVYARAAGTTAGFDSYSYLTGDYLLGNVCNFTSSFTTSPASPQPVGTSINLTAAATCTGGTAQYRFAYNAPGTSNYVDVGSGWGAATQSWSTTGLPTGSYNLIVYSRAAGNTSSWESYKYTTFSLGAAASLCSSGTTISASPTAPQPVGAMITLTGTSTCSAPQFRFSYRLKGNSTWILTGLSAYSSSPQTWNTTGLASGTYELMVEARNTGNVGQSESTAVIANYGIGSTCGSVALSDSPHRLSTVGAQVTFTGNATCSSGAMAEYRYSYSQNGGAYTLLRTYGPAAYVWDTSTSAATNYAILVEARAVGSTGPDSQFAIPYTLSGAYGTQINSGGGSHHACARVSNGMARCWGQNDFGQLGNGTTSASSSSPVTVTGLTNVLQVATGASHSCALLTDTTVRCWGLNTKGELGNGSTTNSSTPVVATGLTGVVALSLGDYHSCALLSSGGITCWGSNSSLQTGTSAPGAAYQVVPTATAITSGATAVSAGGFHTCALVGGGVKCWGDNTSGQLGTGGTPAQNSVAPLDVPGLTSGVTSVASGELHVCAVVGGAVQCWGDNSFGQLGNGAISATPTTSPAVVPGLSGVAEMASGLVFSCARLTNQTVKCWGRNTEGEIGDGTTVDRLSPTSVSGISTATSITVGGVSGCALLSNSQTACWGYGGFGGLGNGSTSNALTPVVVAYP